MRYNSGTKMGAKTTEIGKAKLVDTAGRVDKFLNRYGKRAAKKEDQADK